MASSRIDIFKQMLVNDPVNSAVLFGLAKEYEKAGLDADLIATLERYLAISEDEGNAYGMLAAAYKRSGDDGQAKITLQKGINTAQAHGHPGMAEEFRMTLASYEE